ncbi:helix-turn-helix domain-containing protein [Flavobacterium sp.]|uniref:helix-turn-helix domain-containing protein n=1 Tax=Flavobacterium sp. TaxID=239 RepID=UPI0040337330
MTENKENIGDKVRETRLAKGFTQSELSELTNISLRSIQRIENGQVNARTYTLKVLASHLDLDLSARNNTGQGILLNDTKASPSRLILSFGIAVVLMLTGGAYLAQSSTFPETTFELLLFWAALSVIYIIVLLKIWK